MVGDEGLDLELKLTLCSYRAVNAVSISSLRTISAIVKVLAVLAKLIFRYGNR